MGLTIPYQRYSGQLQYAKEMNSEVQKSSKSLEGFYNYLKKLSDQNELLANLDLSALKSDLGRNLYFNSNIPQGYGVGSSGAICAAFFDAYLLDDINKNKERCLPELKMHFAQMESYFHGVSSGLDPLNSYLKKGMLIHNKEQLEIVDKASGFKKDELTTFLIDTNMSGETDQLVHVFFDKCRHYAFYKEIKNNLIQLNNACIEQYMKGDLKEFLNTIKELSIFFFTHFKHMIPSTFIEQWEKGILNKIYTLKLCGSGGGGFLLGFTEDYEATKKEFQGFNLQKLNI
jgi:mevalonate kinase